MFPEINIATFALENDHDILTAIGDSLKKAGINEYRLFATSAEMLEQLHEDVHICVVDYHLEEERTGLEVMKAVLEHNPDCYVIGLGEKVKIDMDVLIAFINGDGYRFVDKSNPMFLTQLIEYVEQAGAAIVRSIKRCIEITSRMDETKKLFADARTGQ